MPERNEMRVLLVGASGRVGGMVLHHWRENDALGFSIVRQDRRDVPPCGLQWSPLDGVGTLVDHVRRSGPINAMVVLAGVTSGPGKDLDLNSALALACVAAAQQAQIGRVLLSSSSAVYGAGKGIPLTEAAPTEPVNAYGKAKCAMELAVAPWRDRGRDRGLDLCCLRIGNVAGADALLLNVARLSPQEPVIIDRFADGQGPIRSYIGAGTLAAVLRTLATQAASLPPVLNIGAPAPVSMEALAHAAGQPYRFRHAPSQARQHITLDCAALARLHPFTTDDSDPHAMVAQWRDAVSV